MGIPAGPAPMSVARAVDVILAQREREPRGSAWPCILCGEVDPEVGCVRGGTIASRWIGEERICGSCWERTHKREPWWLRLLRWAVR